MKTRLPLSALALVPAFVAQAAHARIEAHPYIEAAQVFSADLSGHDNDAVTYTEIGAGIGIVANGRNFVGQVDYRYDHFFAWSKHRSDGDVHSGLASATYNLGSGFTVQAAGIAVRTRGTLTQASPGLYAGDFSNTQQTYAVEAGPSYAGRIGPLAVRGDYRFGWTKTDNGVGTLDLGPGQPRLNSGFVTTSHTVSGSAGMPYSDGLLPFGWTVSGGYIRDDVHFLDAHYDGSFVRGDVTVPLGPTVALIGGAGYEWNESSVAPILTDANGNAILTDSRRLQADRDAPRILFYDESGLIWDVGVLWRPSPRLQLEARGGRRYGETAVTGSLNWRPSRTETVQVVAYNDVTSSGRQLTGGIATVPTSFAAPGGISTLSLGGCVFGANGGAGTCIPALSSTNANFYRSRGVYALVSAVRGRWTFGLGADYDHRHYLAADGGPANIASYAGVHEDSVTVNGVASRRLSPNSTISGSAYAAWYHTDLFDSPHYTTYGVTGAYSRLFTRNLSGQAAVSIYSGAGDRVDEDVIGTAILAVRYQL